jgi:Cu-Zn family superoxide dismutase
MKRIVFILSSYLIISMLAIAGCQQKPPETTEDPIQEELVVNEDIIAVNNAICVLHPTEGNDVTGTVTFEQTEGGVKVVAQVEGLTPGKHGFHIHTYGDCSAPDATSAGGHFNPEDEPHGAPSDMQRHVGDLGNIEANEEGIANMEMIDPKLTLSGKNSIVGRAIIVHQGEDDLESQPTGNAGPRVACGVIGIDEEE